MKHIVFYFLLLLAGFSATAQLDGGSYKGFRVVTDEEQPDIIDITVLELGNGVTQFTDATNKKPLQGKYHIIIHRNKYHIGNFIKGIPNGDWDYYFYGRLYDKYNLKNGRYDGKQYEYGYGYGDGITPSEVYTYNNGIIQHYIEYHKNGKIRTERFYDERGSINGVVKSFFEDGKLKEERNYKNGKYHGKQMEIISDFKETLEYTNGVQTGNYCRWYPNGKIQRKGAYDDNGKKVGRWIYCNENGDMESEEQYLNGLLYGKKRTYYKGEILRSEEDYVNGKLNGKRIEYDENPHVISRETTYVDDKQNGEFKIYHKGILWRSGIYKDYRAVMEKEYQDGKLQIIRLLDENNQLINVEQYNPEGKRTYKNQTYKKHPSINLKEDASGIIDITD